MARSNLYKCMGNFFFPGGLLKLLMLVFLEEKS